MVLFIGSVRIERLESHEACALKNDVVDLGSLIYLKFA